MPLLDHFHPPLSVRRHWHSFHHAWATSIASELNSRLPEGYFAEPNVQFGIPFSIVTDSVEVLVFESSAGPDLAGAIELVSPANKDRADHRNAFVTKCAAYLQQGLGLVIVDVVTGRRFNGHKALLKRLGTDATTPIDTNLYASSYRPVDRDGQSSLDIWREGLAIGKSLPSLPLWLRGSLCLRVDLDATYDRTCREQRIPVNT
jgi:hypothetical protein